MNTAFKIIMAEIYFWLFSINKKTLIVSIVINNNLEILVCHYVVNMTHYQSLIYPRKRLLLSDCVPHALIYRPLHQSYYIEMGVLFL